MPGYSRDSPIVNQPPFDPLNPRWLCSPTQPIYKPAAR